ncbi:MAG: hypothetical protein HY809_08635 [Nitrospirae bacterium]|nr:hypothetical protein [Nitrospirota bacterium]
MNYIVTTTINIPVLLKDYVNDFNEFGHDYLVVVAGDLKSPPETRDFCSKLKNVVYLDVDDQKGLFGSLAIYDHIPFNSVQRRNFGYLYCVREGIGKDDILVTIDDDNFLKDKDYLGRHNKNPFLTGSMFESGRTAWFNPLELFYDELIFHRGYTFFERGKNTLPEIKNSKSLIAVNAGLWEKNPDVDALTRFKGLSGDYKVKREEPVILGRNAWCSFNSQNTAYLNDFWITAFLCPYIGRYDDIFSSYITKRIADKLGYCVSYGQPVVVQERNVHNIYNDVMLEIHGMSLTDNFVGFLSELNIKSSDIAGCYSEIMEGLRRDFVPYSFDKGGHPFARTKWDISEMPKGMALWLDALEKLKR